MTRFASLFLLVLASIPAFPQLTRGYYRYPAIFNNTIVFTAEGDLWTAPVTGGVARRLTTNPGQETHPAFSPDGTTLAFSGSYEGSTDVYTMPSGGGLPARRTFEGNALAVGWHPDGRVLYSTSAYSTLPSRQLVALGEKNQKERIPLAQAAYGTYDSTGKSLFFARLPFQGSQAKRYEGGSVENLWRFSPNSEAVPLTKDSPRTSKNPMYWKGRVYFLSDRDGTMNVWSMDESGKGLKQHTKHEEFDIQTASLSNGRIAYQWQADIHVLDIASGKTSKVEIELSSDFDQLRERWIKDPSQFGLSISLGFDGSQLALTSRGKAFVMPVKAGRLVDASGTRKARIRDSRLMPDGKSLLAISSESGEMEFWKLPANGIGPGEQLTSNAKVLRWQGIPSPDGKWLAHQDKDNQLWLLDLTSKAERKLFVVDYGGSSFPAYDDIRWSPDSRWFTFSMSAPNTMDRIYVCNAESGALTPLTTDRYNSFNAAWSEDGKWIYFLSDRSLKSLVSSPWGPRQPDPYFTKSIKIYQLALTKGQRSPFEPADELNPDKKPDEKKESAKPAGEKKPDDKTEPAKKPPVEIDFEGIAARIREIPVPAGEYRGLETAGKRICWIERVPGEPAKNSLQCLEVSNKGDKPDVVMEGVSGFEFSGDGKKLLIQKGGDVYVVDSTAKGSSLKDPKALGEAKVDVKAAQFSVIPAIEFRELYLDAWRLHRDYFYDRNMHGIDWPKMRDKYLPLVDRVRDRSELNDVIAQLVAELSALHTFVRGGDQRQSPDSIGLAFLGARLQRDDTAGGYRVEHIYQSDPDRPDLASPLARPGVDMADGDIIVQVNGRDTLSTSDIGELLRSQAGKQVLLRVRPNGKTEARDVLVKPLAAREESSLRYHEWEFTRRLTTEKLGGGKLGYLHLRAMGPNDIADFAEQFYPIFDREGLILDFRHNRGGNIDSWVLNKLTRKAWMYWQARVGKPTWNMQYAFRGHMVILCDEATASDGEAVSEGFRRLGLGKLIGARTWGGEIWLTSSNTLADQGIASAAEIGVFGPVKGKDEWLIEGHGVVPDIEVDNLPHETFNGKDAQLEAAVAHLRKLIQERPIPVPVAPKYPDKRFPAVTSAPGRAVGGGSR